MNGIVDRLFGWMNQNHSQETPTTDPTMYWVVTNTNSYHGQIIVQDDIQLKLKTEGRVVKVLKQNIQRIAISKPGTQSI